MNKSVNFSNVNSDYRFQQDFSDIASQSIYPPNMSRCKCKFVSNQKALMFSYRPKLKTKTASLVTQSDQEVSF